MRPGMRTGICGTMLCHLLLVSLHWLSATTFDDCGHMGDAVRAEGPDAGDSRLQLVSPTVLNLRGGREQGKRARGQAPAPRIRAAQGGERAGMVHGGANLKKRLQIKLHTLGVQRRILEGYERSWAAEKEKPDAAGQLERAGGVHDEKASTSIGCAKVERVERDRIKDEDESEDKADEPKKLGTTTRAQQRSHAAQADACGASAATSYSDPHSSEEGDGGGAQRPSRPENSGAGEEEVVASGQGAGSGPDALLRALERSGLLAKGELDSRVSAFIVKLKKEGKRAALIAALEAFREHLRRPRSHKLRVRNKSAVLTKLLLMHVRLLDGGGSTMDGAADVGARSSNGMQSREGWARDLSWRVGVRGWEREGELGGGGEGGQDGLGGRDEEGGEGLEARALQDSVFQVEYPTAVSQRVLRFGREGAGGRGDGLQQYMGVEVCKPFALHPTPDTRHSAICRLQSWI
jgi:hypothetical protein